MPCSFQPGITVCISSDFDLQDFDCNMKSSPQTNENIDLYDAFGFVPPCPSFWNLAFRIQTEKRKDCGMPWFLIRKRGRERDASMHRLQLVSLICSDKLPHANTSVSWALRKKERKKFIHYQWASFIRRWRAVGDVQTLQNIINITAGFLSAMLSFQLQMRNAAEELFMTIACLLTSIKSYYRKSSDSDHNIRHSSLKC